MRRVLLALFAVMALGAGSIGAANAQDVRIGPGGVDVGPHRHYYDSDNCRTVIEHHTNRFGDDVTTRRRVCD